MEPTIVVERDCSALGGLFQIIVNDMKGGNATWDDFIVKANKFHSQLKATIAASTVFLDAFQKIADMATSTRGGTKDIGTALTRLCLRHRSVEARLKTFTSSIMDCLILPLQDRIEEWKKTSLQLDKDHSKEYKRLRQELKKKQAFDSTNSLSASTSNTLKFKKHMRNKLKIDGNNWNSLHSMSRSMDSMEGNEKLFMFEEMEKKAVRRALIEERSHFCLFVNFLRPVVEEELAMLQEVTHLQEILDALCKMTSDPYSLPSSSELVITDLRLSSSETAQWSLQTPPSSPSSFGSRKSSMCSISSFNSSSSGSTHSPSHHCRYRSLSQPSVCPGPVFRHTSISSQDSGFMSQDYNFLHYAQLPICTTAKYVNHFKNNEVSSLSEQSSGSTSSTSSIPATNQRIDGNHRSHTISTYDKNRCYVKSQSYEPPLSHESYTMDKTNNSEESLICILNNHNSGNNEVELKSSYKSENPELPSREAILDKPLIPAKPNTFNYGISMALTQSSSNIDTNSLYCESHPIYANSSEIMNEELNVACSEGSITPTNPERSGSPCSEVYSQHKSASFNCSTIAIPRPVKPAPPPPVRRTSTLSNPNAITFGTLKSAGVNTYEEIQNLNRTYSTYEDINDLSVSLQNISASEGLNDNIYSRNPEIYSNNSCLSSPKSTSNLSKNVEYRTAKSIFESTSNRGSQLQPNHMLEEESTQLPLPAPPPEAFSDSEATHGHHYNKITNVHRQFLETLNSKLGQFPQSQHISPRVIKRRSVSLTHSSEDDWNSDSAVPNRSTSQTQSIQQTLMMLMTGNHSRSSSASSTSSARQRRQSPDNSRKKAAFTLASCDRESLMASLNMRLAQRQQNEIAKAAAAHAMQRKQSVPDLNLTSNQLQNQQIMSSSSFNLSNVQQSQQLQQSQPQPIFQPIRQQMQQMRASNSEEQKNAIYQPIGQPVQQQQQHQQQIYGPVLHQQQLQRRSSQPTMGIKIINTTASRQQQIYESSIDKQAVKPAQQNTTVQIGPQSHYQSFSADYCSNSKHNNNSSMPDSNNKEVSKVIYNSPKVKPKSGNISSRTQSTPDSFESAVAARVNSWFNSVQLPTELKLCRESLMDQIRRGKQLRKVSTSNDRSAPKFA